MEKYENILILDNDIEANLLASILEERGIPHVIKPHHDSVFSGIFEPQFGWGQLDAPAAYRDEVLEIYNDIRTGGGIETDA